MQNNITTIRNTEVDSKVSGSANHNPNSPSFLRRSAWICISLIFGCFWWGSAQTTPYPTTGNISFNRIVEAPPASYTAGPSQTGATTEVRLPSVDAVNSLCQAALGALPQRFSGRGPRFMACYIPNLDQVVLPDPKAWPSRREWEEIREHEWAHARGWRHNENGRGANWATSLPPKTAPTA